MSPEETAFIGAICADPESDLPRLVFADWLDEQGRVEQAEFIRLQCEYAGLMCGESEAEAGELQSRLFELEDQCVSDWQAHLQLPKSRTTTYWARRGLIAKLWCTAKFFLSHGERIQRLSPVTSICFRRLVPSNVRQIAKIASFDGVRELEFLMDEVPITTVEAFLRGVDCSWLNSLELCVQTVCSLSNTWFTRNGPLAETIALTPSLANLIRLDLRHVGIGGAGAVALSESRYLDNLRVLQVEHNGLSERAETRLRSRFGNAVILDKADYLRFTHAQLGWDS